jgi:uncharacterized protein
MDITPLIPTGKKIITAYGAGAFKINGETYTGGIVISPDTVAAWPVTKVEDITAECIVPFFMVNNVEIIIIGCGTNHTPLPPEVSSIFRTHNITVEAMTTGAACRTYNVLLAEGRAVAAALLAV